MKYRRNLLAAAYNAFIFVFVFDLKHLWKKFAPPRCLWVKVSIASCSFVKSADVFL